nr:hypothetical protein [Bacteroidota bacterium]
GITLTGELVYQNTGELVAGEKKFVLSYDISTYANENKIIAVEAQRDLYWVNGYITPYQPYDDEFEMTGGANANYYNHVLTGTPDVPMSIVFTMDWKIKTICDNPISQGTFDISLFPDGSEILLRGEFIDTDQDDCSDKVLIKNFADTYAFPYYL